MQAGPDALRQYGRFVGTRFKDLHNIVWMLGGDYALSAPERWVADELAAGLAEGEARQIMTAHGGQTTGVTTYGKRRWLAMDTVYSYKPDLGPELLAAYRERPIRPFVLIESTYEGEHDAAPAQIRRQAWTADAVGRGRPVLRQQPDLALRRPDAFPVQRRLAAGARRAGSQDMARLGVFFRSQRWTELQPLPVGHIAVTDSGPPPMAAASTDGTLTIVYVPAHGSGSRELRLDRRGTPTATRAQWFDPSSDAPMIDVTGMSRAESSRILALQARTAVARTIGY